MDARGRRLVRSRVRAAMAAVSAGTASARRGAGRSAAKECRELHGVMLKHPHNNAIGKKRGKGAEDKGER